MRLFSTVSVSAVTGNIISAPLLPGAGRAEEPRTRSVTSLAAWVREVTGDGAPPGPAGPPGPPREEAGRK